VTEAREGIDGLPHPAVVIRARDEVEWIGRVLDRVLGQTVRAEVVVVDSGSSDGTLEVVAARGIRVVTLAPGEFTYGRALNLGIAATMGEIAVALSAHAMPADDRWLERLLAPFDDPTVAATYGRQLPHPGLDPFRAREVREWWGDAPREDTRDHVRFSNSNGAVRRSVWAEQPFDELLPYSEDDAWASSALDAGYRVCYVPDAAVYHSHSEGPLRHYRRQRAQALAGGATTLGWGAAARRFYALTWRDMATLKREGGWRWAPLSPLLRGAEVLAQRSAGQQAG
jgi:rhamnosyltransferase